VEGQSEVDERLGDASENEDTELKPAGESECAFR
jgi:hypothetical protein